MTEAPADNRTRTLAAARALFFEKGFAATSSRAIAQKAGTSKATIYAAFGSMEGLLAAVIADEVARFDAPGGAEIMDFESFRAAMVTFGGRLLTFLGDPETFRFSRIMHEEARGRPEVTRIYFEAAYQGTCDR
ncbi:MAG: helix-turn-helix domain-containing protein, partial [Pseudomonadota bacterium]